MGIRQAVEIDCRSVAGALSRLPEWIPRTAGGPQVVKVRIDLPPGEARLWFDLPLAGHGLQDRVGCRGRLGRHGSGERHAEASPDRKPVDEPLPTTQTDCHERHPGLTTPSG